MNPHLLRKFRQRRDVLGITDIVRGTRTILTCTRATAARYFDSTGTLQTAAINEKVFEYDPITGLFLGLRREMARTNSIRNNTMVGATVGVLGSGGALPTNWSRVGGGGLVVEVLATGVSAGVAYIDIRVSGTASSGAFINFQFDAVTAISASASQKWVPSVFFAKTAGTFTGFSGATLNCAAYNITPAYISEVTSPLSVAGAGTTMTRFVPAAGTTPANTAYLIEYVQLPYSGTPTVDVTLRIGMPQTEQVGSSTSKASSPIDTSGSAVARSADLMSLTSSDFTSLGVGSGGSLFARFRLANVANGGNQFVARLSDNGYNNQISLGSSSTGFPAISTASGGVFDGSASGGIVLTDGTFAGAAAAYAANDLAISKDGAAVGTDASATIPSGLTRWDVGSDHAGANDCEILHLAYLGWLPSRAPNNTLIARAA